MDGFGSTDLDPGQRVVFAERGGGGGLSLPCAVIGAR